MSGTGGRAKPLNAKTRAALPVALRVLDDQVRYLEGALANEHPLVPQLRDEFAEQREGARPGARVVGLQAVGGAGMRSENCRLARANGWGSAGECPAEMAAKTPAVRERVSRVAAGGIRHGAADTPARVSVHYRPGEVVG